MRCAVVTGVRTCALPILIRVGRGLELTRKAEALALPLREALAAVEHTLAQNRGFDPSQDAMTFSIAASDYAVLVLLAPFVRALSVEAPNVTVHLLPRSKASKEIGRASCRERVCQDG